MVATVTAALAGVLASFALSASDRGTSHPVAVAAWASGRPTASLAVVTHVGMHRSPPLSPGRAATDGTVSPDRSGLTSASSPAPTPDSHSSHGSHGSSRPLHTTEARSIRSNAPGSPAGSGSIHPPAISPAQLVAGVGRIPSGWVAAAHTVDAGGLAREYLTVEPAHPTPGLPVVLLLHGRGMTPDSVLRISGLADQIGPALLVVPAGWDRSWNAGDCCGAAYRANVSDVAFIRSVLASVLSTDPGGQASKVYAVGFSNGGRLAYLLACDMPGAFTGFVAVEAVPVEACTPPRPLDVTIVAQQSDPLLTVAGGPPKTIDGFTEPTVTDTVARLQSADHCAGPPARADDGLSVEQTWTCADGKQLHYVWYPAGAHDWRPPSAGTPGATDFVLQMLGREPLSSTPGAVSPRA